MPTKNIKAIVLSRKNIGEADRLLLCFSEEEGKIKIIARGSRKIKSKLASHIEPFCIADYYIAEKNNKILAGAECIYFSDAIVFDLEIYRQLSYAAELTNNLMPEGLPNKRIYKELVFLIRCAAKTPVERFRVYMDRYVLLLLLENGYVADLSYCRDCHKKLKLQMFYSGGLDGIYCHSCKSGKEIPLNVYKLIKLFTTSEYNIEKVACIEELHGCIYALNENVVRGVLGRKTKSESIS